MEGELDKLKNLFEELLLQDEIFFPSLQKGVPAPKEQGVYIIFSPDKKVLHVGRTLRNKDGLKGRLGSHVNGNSSFMHKFYQKNNRILRETHSFKYIVVENDRLRALLEAYATSQLCPEHLGTGA